MNNSNILSAFNWRYATKHFDSSKKISTENLEILEKSLILSPSSFGLQPYKFLFVQNQEIRKKLTPHSWNQAQVEECSHLVVFLGRKKMDENYIDKFIGLTASERGISVEMLKDYKAMMMANLVGENARDVPNWAAKQAYIALGNLMTTAALINVDTCPMEGIDTAKYDEILNLQNSDYTTLCVCALGFRSLDDKYQNLKKVRFAKSDLIESF